MAEEKKAKKPKNKFLAISEWIITILFGLVFLFMAAGSIDGMIKKKDNFGQTLRFGLGLFVVQTDSMEPYYKIDSAIITYKESADRIYKDYKKGKTIDLTFMDKERTSDVPTIVDADGKDVYYDPTPPTHAVMTHRLREIIVHENVEVGKGRYTFIVAGTNISEHQAQAGQYQSFTEKYLLGVVKSNSQFIGGLLNFISSPFGLLVLLLIPAFFLIITSVIDIFKAYKDPEEAPAGNTPKKGEAGETKANSGVTELSEADKKRLKEQLLEEMLSKKKGDGK